MLVGRPALLQNLLESRRAFGVGTYRVFERGLSDMLRQAPDISEKLDVLRRFKHQEEIRIGMADLLSNIGLIAVSRDLSKLAEVCLNAALQLAFSEISRRFNFSPGSGAGLAIIGVGKLGGRELTYGSDLDILFVFSEPRVDAHPADLSIFEYLSKVAEKTIAYLSTLTREGFAFRIDARLRPTGSKGPLVQSIDAFKSYYADQAQTWERQAFLRARPVAGDRELGSVFCSGIESIIYRDDDQRLLADEVRSMRRKIEEEVGKEGATYYNIKQGKGGIVDIEFIVQYLQLLHGRRHPRVRVSGTYNALRALKRERLLSRENCLFLMKSYLFLHRIESRLRIVANQSTSELNKDDKALAPLARRMGYQDGAMLSGLQLLEEYRSIAGQVRTLFLKVLTDFS
jgi:glutamate-ammonia-ligase adenylyltransferase